MSALEVPRRVLFVDDDASVIAGLKKALHRFRDRWTVETMTSPHAALARLTQTPFDAVVSDARMPEMAGAEFLKAVGEQWPGTLRVALSGDTSREGAERLMRCAHQFIPKPVTPQVLFARIEDALEARQRLATPGLKELVMRLGSLPAMPATFAAITRLSEQPETPLDAFVRAVEADAAVCANVMRVVNSAWFGLSKPVASLRDAVRMLGIRPLSMVVLASEVFGGSSPGIEKLRREALERLSILPRALTLLGVTAMREDAATALVLVDVGQLVLHLKRPAEAAAIDQRADAGADRLTDEREVFGADHALVGAVLLQLWSLPPHLIESLALHHHPRASSAPSLGTVVSLICTLQALRDAPSGRRESLLEEVKALAEPFAQPGLETLLTLFAPENIS